MIYLDYAATSPMKSDTIQYMTDLYTRQWGNPSSTYGIGRNAHSIIDIVRQRAASLLGVMQNEIFFTSGGSESNNWAIKGIMDSVDSSKNHIITSSIEHPSVLKTCQYLEQKGFKISYLPVDRTGLVSVSDLRKAILPETAIVSIMMANNEVGTIQPILELSRFTREHGICFHTDAVQCIGHIPFKITDFDIDLLSISGHKFGGPKGSGILYIKKGTRIANYIHGGAQEKGMRAGTENIAGIAGMIYAMENAIKEIDSNTNKISLLREYLKSLLLKNISDIIINENIDHHLPGILNVSIPGITSSLLVTKLDLHNICVSSGSACSSGIVNHSHVLKSMNVPSDYATIRLSIGPDNTNTEIEIVCDEIRKILYSRSTL